jgi:hypothetical protein
VRRGQRFHRDGEAHCRARRIRRESAPPESSIIVEGARGRASRKRDGGCERIPVADVQLPSQEPPDYLAIDSALKRLQARDRNQ